MTETKETAETEEITATDKAAVENAFSAVQEKTPYAKWQKEGYELVLGVELPDYYYVMPETKREDGRLCHRINLVIDGGVSGKKENFC